MAISEYNYIPEYTRLGVNNKPKDVITASYWNGLFNSLSHQGDHTAEELGNILNHFTTVITGAASDTADAIAEEHEYASAFEIHLSTNANPITADKTFAEIRQAIVDKREILLWVSEVQCLKPTCKAFEHTITLTVFDYSFAGPVVRADVYECYDENEWFISQSIELAKQNDVGDIRDLTTTHKSDLVAAINEVKQTTDTKQDKLIPGDNITIAADGKTISAIGGSSASIAMRVNGGYIQYSTDNGNTWSNLIAEADLKGDKGDTGAIGPQGLQGIQGPKGEKGDTGPQGSIGETGPAGPAGPQGPKGDTGETGSQGDTGPQGPKGDKGDPGADGISLYTTTQDSALETTPFDIIYITTNDRTLVVGDLILTPTGRLYRVTSVSTSFVDAEYITSLRGPQGIKGGKGDTGPQGPKGDTGSAGANGKSAYQYAVEGGYTGTETKFAEKLASGTMFVTITDNNGTLSADKSYNDIENAILDGTPVLVDYADTGLPLIAIFADALWFGTIQCDSGDASNGAAVATVVIEITQNGEVNDISAQIDIPKTLPNPHAITFTGAVTGSYDGSNTKTVNIPSAVTDAHINSLIDTKLGVIENGAY